MRTIKFRGKRIDNGEWVYGDLCTKDIHHGVSILTDGVIRNAVRPDTVGQFTGEFDKDKREIYEGDIILEQIDRAHIDKRIVQYYNGSFLAVSTYTSGDQAYGAWHEKYQSLKYLADTGANITVIGNIHDNPELINTK